LFAARCLAADSYDESTLRYDIDADLRSRNTQVDVDSQLRQTIDGLLKRASTLEAALREYNVNVPDINNARKTLADMEKSECWRDLGSRTTTKRRQAGYNLGKYLYDAQALLNVAQERLNEQKERAYRAWAIKHPEEAKALERNMEVERRLQKAESTAREAQARAESAEAAAGAAIDAADKAQRTADDANAKANAARAREASRASEVHLPSHTSSFAAPEVHYEGLPRPFVTTPRPTSAFPDYDASE
jgi:hypothetical protein